MTSGNSIHVGSKVEFSVLSKDVAENPEWLNAVNQASGWIREVIGKWEEDKSWRWSMANTSPQRPLFDLSLESGAHAISDRFSKSELTNEQVFKDRVFALWGKLVDREIDNLRSTIRTLVREIEEEATVAPAN